MSDPLAGPARWHASYTATQQPKATTVTTRRRRQPCCHRTTQTISTGVVLCTDQCTRTFPTLDDWARAVRDVAETIIARALSGGGKAA